jgi:long-subunit fatty acid transport protein
MLNPAGLGHIKGTLIHVGNRFSYNSQEYTRAPTIDYGSPDAAGNFPTHTFARVHNTRPLQALDPIAGVASNLGLESWVFALALQAPPGVARQSFPIDGGQRYLMTDYEALMLNYSLSAAWKANENFGLGASVQWIHVPRLKYSLIINANPFIGGANPVSSNLDMLASVSGSAPFTLNTVVGAWYRPLPAIELGIAGQVIPTQIRMKGRLNVTPVASSTDDTVELTRNGDPANDIDLTIPLPLMGRAGIRYRHLLPKDQELFDIELDVVYESWSRVNHFTVATRGLQAAYLGQQSNLGDIYVEKRWRDTIGVHLGGDYAIIPSVLALSGGVFYQNPLANSAYANVDFATGAQLGAAIGGTIAWNHQRIAVAYEFRQQQTVTLSEAQSRIYQTAPLSQCKPPYTDRSRCSSYYLGLPGPPVNAGTYDARNHLLAVDWLYQF